MADVKMQKFGTREQVYNGLAHQTKGKLTKGDLIFCEKTNKYKSIKAIERGRSVIQNVRKSVVVPVEEVPPTPAPTPKPVEEKPKRQRKKVPEATD
jgi:hypothetical protein